MASTFVCLIISSHPGPCLARLAGERESSQGGEQWMAPMFFRRAAEINWSYEKGESASRHGMGMAVVL